MNRNRIENELTLPKFPHQSQSSTKINIIYY